KITLAQPMTFAKLGGPDTYTQTLYDIQLDDGRALLGVNEGRIAASRPTAPATTPAPPSTPKPPPPPSMPEPEATTEAPSGMSPGEIAFAKNRIDFAYRKRAPKMTREVRRKNIEALWQAITTGTYSDILDLSNAASRKVFEEVTGVSLPGTLAAT